MWQRCLQTATLVVLTGCASDNPFSRLARRNADTPPPLYAGDGEPTQPSKKPLLSALSREDGAVTETLKSAEVAEDGGRLPEARGLYERVLTYKPDHPRAHHRLATIADRESRFGDAERHYQSALKSRPKDADILSDLGYSYQLQGRYAESEQRLSTALRANPKHRQALFNLGNLYAMHGRDEDALTLYRKAGSESEAQAALAQAKRSDSSVQMASHLRSPTRTASASPVDKSADPAKKYPNAATRKLAEDMERRRNEYDRTAARGRPGQQDLAGYGAPPEQATMQSTEEMRARFEQIDQQFDGVNANPPPIMVGPQNAGPQYGGLDRGPSPEGTIGQHQADPRNAALPAGYGAGPAHAAQGQIAHGYNTTPAGNTPSGWPNNQASTGMPQSHAGAYAPPSGGVMAAGFGGNDPAGQVDAEDPAWRQLATPAPTWSGAHGSTGVPPAASGYPAQRTSMMAPASPQAAQRAAQLGLGAGQGSLSFDDSGEASPSNPYPPQGGPMGGQRAPVAGSVEEAEMRTLQQQMQQLQQRQWQLQQRMQTPNAPQIRPGTPQ